MLKNLPKKKKIILTVLLILIVLLVVVFIATRAFINPAVSTEAITNVNISSCGYFKLDEKSSAINLTESFPMSDNRGMLLDPYTFTLTNSCDTDKGFNIYLVVTTESQIPSNKVKVNLSTEEKSLVTDLPTAVLEENINTQYETKTGKEAKEVYLLKNATLGADATVEFDFRMWLDYYLAGNEEQNKTYEVSILVADGETSGQIFMPSISNFCTGDVISTCFTENIPNSNLNNVLIQHTPEKTTSAGDNNYRYSGGNDIVQNYVCFGSDEAVCPKESLYRILGIYNIEGEQLVKIIKALPIDKNKDGTYDVGTNQTDTFAFDAGNDNRWEGVDTTDTSDDADINKYLNGTYLQELPIKYQEMIEPVKFKIGGIPWNSIYKPKDYYTGEQTAETVQKYKIGLMNASEYLYGASESNWNLLNSGNSSTNDYYQNEEMKANNWMYLSDYASNYREWTLVPSASFSSSVYGVDYGGSVFDYYANNGYASRPISYLKSNIILVGGTGSEAEPFKIEL